MAGAWLPKALDLTGLPEEFRRPIKEPTVQFDMSEWDNDLAALPGGNPKNTVPIRAEGDMTEKTINAALDKVAVFEGGYVNDPADSGGETNHGVTLKFLQSVQPEATSADLKKLTKADARQLFRTHFVDKPQLNLLPDVAQAEAIGLSINAGPRRAIKVLQGAAGVAQDGKLGPETIRAVGKLSNEDIKKAVDGFYTRLAEAEPKNKKFLKGWLNRSAGLSGIPLDE